MLAFDVRLVTVATLEVAVALAEAAGLMLLEPAESFVEEGAEEAILIICSHATLWHAVKQFFQGHILRRLIAVLVLAFALSVLAAFVILAFSLWGRPNSLSWPRQGCKASNHQRVVCSTGNVCVQRRRHPYTHRQGASTFLGNDLPELLVCSHDLLDSGVLVPCRAGFQARTGTCSCATAPEP